MPCRSRSATGSRRSGRSRPATWASVRPRTVRQRRICAPTARRGFGAAVAASRVAMLVCPQQTHIDISIHCGVWLHQQRTAGVSEHPARTEDHAMKVAIIGAGNVGTALATSLARAGHDVIITSRDPEHAAEAAAGVGRARRRHRTPRPPPQGDVVIPAVGFTDLAEVAADIAEPAAGKPVVDVTNRISFGAAGPEIDTTSSNAEAARGAAPRAARSSRRSTRCSRRTRSIPIADGVQLDGYVAGDDAVGQGQGARARPLDRPAPDRRRSARPGPPARGRSPSSTWRSTSSTTVRGSPAGSWSAPRSARSDGWPFVSIPVARLNHAVLYVRDATAVRGVLRPGLRVRGRRERVRRAGRVHAVGQRREPPRPRPVLGRRRTRRARRAARSACTTSPGRCRRSTISPRPPRRSRRSEPSAARPTTA